MNETVADLVKTAFPRCRCFAPENAFLASIPAESPVGEAADLVIQAAIIFASKLDPHPTVQAGIGQAVIEHIRILYYG